VEFAFQAALLPEELLHRVFRNNGVADADDFHIIIPVVSLLKRGQGPHKSTMTSPWIRVQLREIVYHISPERIEVDISGQLHKVGIVFTDNGFVSLLKKMPIALVPSVKIDHIPGKKLSHGMGKGVFFYLVIPQFIAGLNLTHSNRRLGF